MQRIDANIEEVRSNLSQAQRQQTDPFLSGKEQRRGCASTTVKVSTRHIREQMAHRQNIFGAHRVRRNLCPTLHVISRRKLRKEVQVRNEWPWQRGLRGKSRKW